MPAPTAVRATTIILQLLLTSPVLQWGDCYMHDSTGNSYQVRDHGSLNPFGYVIYPEAVLSE